MASDRVNRLRRTNSKLLLGERVTAQLVVESDLLVRGELALVDGEVEGGDDVDVETVV